MTHDDPGRPIPPTALVDALLAAHPDFLYVLDAEHRFVLVSPSLLQLWERTAEEALGKTFEELGYPPHLVELHRRQLDEALAGRTVRGENEYVSPAGVSGYYEYIFVPLRSGDEVLGVAGVTRDLTARRHLEQRLAEEVAARERIMGIVGHDLRNPLGAIVSAADLLLRQEATSEAQARVVRRITSAAARMTALIGDLLDFSRVRSGVLPITPAPCDVNELVRDVVAEVNLAESGRVRLEAEGDGMADVDCGRLAQALTNLVQNALDHGDARAPVHVAVRGGDGARVDIDVTNVGPPVSADQLQRLTAPFERGATARPGSGLGLGLFIVEQIVRAHGGELSVRSGGEAGTTFSMRLPRKACPSTR